MCNSASSSEYSSLSVKHGLQLSLSTDAVGTYAVVKCNKVLGNFYLDRLGKRNPGKCVLVGDTWYTPLEVEALGGKRQKNGDKPCPIWENL